MRTYNFLSRLDHNRVTQAIKKAEGKSSGQIRVFIQRGKFEDDALPRAERRFLQLGMQKTRDRNAVLIREVLDALDVRVARHQREGAHEADPVIEGHRQEGHQVSQVLPLH